MHFYDIITAENVGTTIPLNDIYDHKPLLGFASREKNNLKKDQIKF